MVCHLLHFFFCEFYFAILPSYFRHSLSFCLTFFFFLKDSFILSRENGQQVEWTKNGVAWESDLDTLFGSYDDEDGGVLMDPPVPGCEDLDNCTFTDPDFVVWMRVAALPTFRKLYRVINSDLERGNYTVNIENSLFFLPYFVFWDPLSLIFSTIFL